MRTIKEFEKEIRERENLIMNILILKRDYEFLSMPDSPGLAIFFNKRPIFARSKNAIFKLLCIEVYKLFSTSRFDHFKWTSLLEKIKEHKDKSDWKKKLSKDDLNRINRLINEGVRNEAIKALKKYRNEYLAHTDISRTEATFFVNKFYRLIDISLEIINLLRTKVLGEQFSLDIYLPNDGFDEIRNLAAD